MIIAVLITVTVLIIYYIYHTSRFSNIIDTCTKVTIDKAFVLTLSTQSERFKKFNESYNLETPLDPIIGYDTRKPEVAEQFRRLVEPDYFEHMYDYDNGVMLRPNHTYFNSGALGCYIGHMMFYEQCFIENLNYAMIFEDNLLFSESFPADVHKTLQIIGSGFDICFLHCWSHIGEDVQLCTSEKITELKWLASTKCYIINVQSMKKYYELFYPISNHIDNVYEVLIAHGAKVYLKHSKSIIIQKTESLIKHVNVAEDKPFKLLSHDYWPKRTYCDENIENQYFR